VRWWVRERLVSVGGWGNFFALVDHDYFLRSMVERLSADEVKRRS
jgi:hypothetical protein